MDYVVHNEDEMTVLAGVLAAQIPVRGVVFLRGTLGAGKTSFARAFIRARAQQDALVVPSPTFTLVQTYDTPLAPVWHFDLYRLTDPEDIFELGWEEALATGLALVEWPERLGPHAPAPITEITITIPQDADAAEASARIGSAAPTVRHVTVTMPQGPDA